MAYRYSMRSKLRMRGLHPDLKRVFLRAIEISDVDISFLEGKRTTKRQQQLYKAGASQLNGISRLSKHQVQSDGFVHAGDAAPYAGGAIRWEWELFYPLAEAIRAAANELGVRIRWGGCWTEITGDNRSCEQMQRDYVERRIRQGRKAFPDGPHFEIIT